MEREQLERLLAEYATGGLSEAETQQLFKAVLSDQDLFDQLMEEDSLREAIEMPGARNRLIDSLQEEITDAVVVLQPAAARSQSKRVPARQPLWLAWASGIAIVLVSGAISYVAFDRPISHEITSVFKQPHQAPKEFVPPPAPTPSAKARPATVEAPPKIFANDAGPSAAPLPVNIPLPLIPPPPPEAEAPKVNKVADAVLSARPERDQVQTEFRAAPSQQQGAVPAPPPQSASAPAPGRRQAVAESVSIGGGAGAIGTIGKNERAREEKAKIAVMPPSLWRLAADGIWVRVPTGDKVPRIATLVIRYVPATSANVVVTDATGRRLVQRQGRPGVELELSVPPPSGSAAELTLTITEGPRATPFKILFE